MSDLKYSRLLCSPRPALGAALNCCRRPHVTFCYLREHVGELGASVKAHLEHLSAVTIPKVSGALHELPRFFCNTSTKFGDGGYVERLPSGLVEQTSVSAITEGPHKLGPAGAPHKVITESPSRLIFDDLRPAASDGLRQLTAGDLQQVDLETSHQQLVIDDLRASNAGKVLAATATGSAAEDAGQEAGGTLGGGRSLQDAVAEPESDGSGSNCYLDSSGGEADTSSGSSSGGSSPPQTPEPPIIGGSHEHLPHSLVLVHLQPDADGRYGFNVKGGVGTSSPVTVSKVAPPVTAAAGAGHSGAPRLTEGDQVVLINGVDVSNFTHDEVVSLIKSCRQLHHQLVLAVKPSVSYESSSYDLEEPLVRFVPDSGPHVSLSVLSDHEATPLAQSIAAIADAVNSGTVRLEFDQLARRAAGLSMDDCRLPHNIAKNRYRDISPYDCTRVRLYSADSGDYINASHVTMEIPGSGVVNRYIAAQGPLKHTSDDFWAMVWEQQSPLVVMLTTLVEQGRVKCHQYWPELDHSRRHGHLQVTCTSEQTTDSFAFRQITLVCLQTGEERHISHMQYVSWPDHGVPDQAADFVQFVQRVRTARAGTVEPTVVHCSAGIGRTGVLILMETAMCLIEANQPVEPLQLVDRMRAQRAMMIQTASQFQFVCQAVVQVYDEGTVRPLAEYSCS